MKLYRDEQCLSAINDRLVYRKILDVMNRHSICQAIRVRREVPQFDDIAYQINQEIEEVRCLHIDLI